MRSLTIIAALSACGSGHDADRERLLAQIKSGPFLDTTAREIADAYHDNEVGADGRFRGHVLRVWGRVDRITREGGHTIVFIYGDKERHDLDELEKLRIIACGYAGDDRLLQPLAHGYKVVVHGLGAGASQSIPLLAECAIEPP
jgi:hypothetical protein